MEGGLLCRVKASLIHPSIARPEHSAGLDEEALGVWKNFDKLGSIEQAAFKADRAAILPEELRPNFNAGVSGAKLAAHKLGHIIVFDNQRKPLTIGQVIFS